MSVLDELWEGGLHPAERSSVWDGESREQLRRLREREEALTAGLSAEQRARFETFMEAYTQYHGLSEKERFIAGFRLGSRLTAEALVENTGIS